MVVGGRHKGKALTGREDEGAVFGFRLHCVSHRPASSAVFHYESLCGTVLATDSMPGPLVGGPAHDWWKKCSGHDVQNPLPSQAEPGSVPATSSNLGLAWGPEHGLVHLHSNSESWHAGQTGWLLGLLIKVCASHSVMPNSLRPHGLQPTSLLCPWDFPGKDTGMGCDFLLPSE